MAYRVDIARFDRVETLSTGGIRVQGNLARTGVLTYVDPDGTERREYRSPEEVFAPASLASMRGVPVTDLHPDGVVDKDNWKELSVGHVGDDVKRDGRFVTAPVVIHDGTEVERVRKGERKELSVGYQCDIDPTPGTTPDGERYDALQKNIRANHVGVGPEGWGRSGSQVALRLDGASVQVQRADTAPKGTNTMKLKVGGQEYRCDDAGDMAAAQGAVDAQKKKADADATALDAAIKQAHDLLDQLAAAKAEVLASKAAPADDDASAEVTDDDVSPEVYDSITRTRALGTKLLGKDAPELKGTPSAIRRAVVAKVMGAEFKLDGRPAGALDGMFLGIARTHEGRNDSLERINRLAHDPHLDAADPVAAAQQRRNEKNANAWKQKRAS